MDEKTKAELREATRQYVQHWLSNPDDDKISDHLVDFEIDNDAHGYPSQESIAFVRDFLLEIGQELESDVRP